MLQNLPMPSLGNEARLKVWRSILRDPLLLFILFLLAVPTDVLNLFSPYNFVSPVDMAYGDSLINEPVSLLYLPLLFSLIARVGQGQSFPRVPLKRMALFAGLFLAWQPFVCWLAPHPWPVGISLELIWAYFGGFLFIYTIYSRLQDPVKLREFFFIFCLIQMIGLAGGLLAGAKSIFERINAPNLDYGNTALIMGAFLLMVANQKGALRLAMVPAVLIMVMTGSRSPLMISAVILPFALAGEGSARKHLMRNLLWLCLAGGIIYGAGRFFMTNVSGGADRMGSLGDLSSIGSDASTIGRAASIVIGVLVLFNNPLGLTFSFFELQRQMNRYGYPTFPHNNVLCLILVFGPFAIPIIYQFLKLGARLFKARSPLKFSYLFILVYSVIAGGCPHQVKELMVYFLFMLLFFFDGLPALPPIKPRTAGG